MWNEERDKGRQGDRERVGGSGGVLGFRGSRVRAGSAFLSSPFTLHSSLFFFLLFTLHSSLLAEGAWRGIYADGPVSVHITPNHNTFLVGDTFRLDITATNTSDRDLLVKRNWKEQLVLYHIHPTTGEQIEWPGQLLMATWMDSSDVVRLGPNQTYKVNRYIRVWIPEDASTFQFRLKLGGVKDYAYKFDMWQGIAWSNPITLTVKPMP
jgi:hypothetical protein